jgi:hypothetical protein
MRTFRLMVKRCNRWDVYPQQETPEEATVTVKYPGHLRIIEDSTRKAGMLTDLLAEQYPKWRVAAPILVKIEEIPNG